MTGYGPDNNQNGDYYYYAVLRLCKKKECCSKQTWAIAGGVFQQSHITLKKSTGKLLYLKSIVLLLISCVNISWYILSIGKPSSYHRPRGQTIYMQ